MKKIALATMLALFAAGSMAASVTFEGQDMDGKRGDASHTSLSVNVKGELAKNLIGDVKFEGIKTDSTQALQNRVEGGLTGLYPVGGVTLYTRAALGENYTGTTNFGYYSIEPGVKAPIGSTGLTAQLGWRFRDAIDDRSTNQFTSRTWRAGVAYDVTKQDQIGVRYDRSRGDAGTNANTVALNYTRSF